MPVVVMLNQKGGVSKTTLTANLGGVLAKQGRRVLLVDADPQSSLTQGVIGPEATSALPAESTIVAAYRGEVARRGAIIDVFPSTEAALIEARGGAFAGCISATANCNADLCARAWSSGDISAHEKAVAIRSLFDGKPLVSGIKALLAHIHGDPALAAMKPPLVPPSAADKAAILAGYDAVRARKVA